MCALRSGLVVFFLITEEVPVARELAEMVRHLQSERESQSPHYQHPHKTRAWGVRLQLCCWRLVETGREMAAAALVPVRRHGPLSASWVCQPCAGPACPPHRHLGSSVTTAILTFCREVCPIRWVLKIRGRVFSTITDPMHRTCKHGMCVSHSSAFPSTDAPVWPARDADQGQTAHVR